MDRLDRKILAELQEDGRLSLTDLASRVGLTLSPAHRRVRDLERSGAIAGYRAIVNPGALGLQFEALVFVTMKQEDRDTLLGFEKAVAEIHTFYKLNAYSATPTICFASAPPTSTPTHDSKTTSSPHCRACNDSPQRSS